MSDGTPSGEGRGSNDGAPPHDRVGLAHAIAGTLRRAGVRGSDGVEVLAIALGLYMAAQDGAHRGVELRPLADAMGPLAQQAFDALHDAGWRPAGHA